tara:strand:- start:197 stop:769 length:573 start_codon:yes stop_codon:yes gene_type:complete
MVISMTEKISIKNNSSPLRVDIHRALNSAITILAVIFIAVIINLNFAWAAEYIDSNNGTITDKSSNLVWQQADSYHELKNGINWYQALEYIDVKNSEKFAGFDDWRLPTIMELKILYDESRPIKSKDNERIGLPNSFKAGGSYYLWTAKERGLENAWYFGLGFKEEYFNLKDLGDLGQGVKMVRGKPVKK